MNERAEHAQLVELLAGYLTHVPPSVIAGSHNRAVEFKAAINAAKKVRTKRGVKNSDLQSAIKSLDRFWQ